MLPTLRTTKVSPGSVEPNTFTATRLSEQTTRSTSGRWPSARCANASL